jgi:hypothetical protein
MGPLKTAPAMQLNSPRSEDVASPPSLVRLSQFLRFATIQIIQTLIRPLKSLSDMLQVDLATAQQLKREQQRRSRRDA